mgnify:CR=1 FL=1
MLMQQNSPLIALAGMDEIEAIIRQSTAVAGGTLVSPEAQAIVIGTVAKRKLDCSLFGRVTAVFESSLYLEVNSSWICLADANLGFGPLTVSIKSKYGREWINSFSVGRLVKFSPVGISTENSTVISTKGARSWQPPKEPSWTKNSLILGLCVLENVAYSKVPAEGLGRFLFECPDSFPASDESRAAEDPIGILKNWLKKCFEVQMPITPNKEAVSALLGLGPGLTPSGDDFLGGMLIALYVCGKKSVQKQLFTQVKSLLNSTGPVSRAHLKAAALGEGSHSLHQVLNMLLEGNETQLEPGIDAINQIGHTSGWDALAGVAVVLRQLASTSCSA